MTKFHSELEGGDGSAWNRDNAWDGRIAGNVNAVLRIIKLHNKGILSLDDVYVGLQKNAISLQITPHDLLEAVHEEIHKENKIGRAHV